MSATVRAQNVDEKRWVTCLVSLFMVLKLPKILLVLQICADLSNESKSIKAIYISI